jgi:hypothetical protein
MTNTDSDSSEFWNLYKKRHEPISESSESSEFWNLYKKKYKKYKIDSIDSISEDFSSEEDDEENEEETTENINSKQIKPDKIVVPNKDETNMFVSVTVPKKQKISIPSKQETNLPPKQETNILLQKITSSTINNETDLPPKQTINGNKKISDYTIAEFYNSFMKNIIEMIKSLKQGKGLNTLLNDKEKLLHLGIGLIILSVILVPLTLN